MLTIEPAPRNCSTTVSHQDYLSGFLYFYGSFLLLMLLALLQKIELSLGPEANSM
jgi:hypothetical protein